MSVSVTLASAVIRDQLMNQESRQRGRPKAEVTKERITIRLSPEVVDSFRATGVGWQTRIDAALKDGLKSCSPA